MMREYKWKVERVRRSKGYKSKKPAADGGVCCFAFNGAELRELAITDTETETRGSACHGLPTSRPGDVARMLLGART